MHSLYVQRLCTHCTYSDYEQYISIISYYAAADDQHVISCYDATDEQYISNLTHITHHPTLTPLPHPTPCPYPTQQPSAKSSAENQDEGSKRSVSWFMNFIREQRGDAKADWLWNRIGTREIVIIFHFHLNIHCY